MNLQPAATRDISTTISELLAAHKQRDDRLFIVIFLIVLTFVPLLVLTGWAVGFSSVLGALAILTIAILIARWPLVGLYVVGGCALLIEQEPLQTTPILTDRLNVFYWPPNLAGFIERPIGLLFIFIFFVLICHRLIRHQRLLRGGELLLPFLFYLLCVASGIVHGLASGGDLKVTVLEVRPFWYLFVSYLLAYNLVTRKSHVYAFFWMVILSAGVKSLQGLYIYLFVLHGDLTNTPWIMAHEESFFFVSLLILSLLLLVHYRYRPQLFAALLIVPCVIVALVANQRRADYVGLLLGIGVLWALLFCIKPHLRKWLVFGMLTFIILTPPYILAFSRSTAWYAQPAREVVSVINPEYTDVRAVGSNLYRWIENTDLKFTAEQNPLLGLGFGKPFLEPIALTSVYPEVLVDDPVYNYIPHNNIYWVWIRLGPIGYFALWYLFGSIIIRGCLTARRLKDPYLQLVAMYTVAMIFVEIVVAFADYQLYFYRNVIYAGLLAGILMKLPSLDEHEKIGAPAHESTGTE